MKNCAKVKDSEFSLICSKEPTDLCKQKDDVSVFSDSRVEAGVGSRSSRRAATEPKDVTCGSGKESRGLMPWTRLKGTEELQKLTRHVRKGKGVFGCTPWVYFFLTWFLLIIEWGSWRLLFWTLCRSTLYLLTFQRCYIMRFVYLMSNKGKCALIFSILFCFIKKGWSQCTECVITCTVLCIHGLYYMFSFLFKTINLLSQLFFFFLS